MLAGVLSGSVSSAPVLILDSGDIKRVQAVGLNAYVKPITMKVERVELVAWRGKLMGLFYLTGQERRVFSGQPHGPGAGPLVRALDGRSDAAMLQEALRFRVADLSFVARTYKPASNADAGIDFREKLTIKLSKAGWSSLSVWLDQALEQQAL